MGFKLPGKSIQSGTSGHSSALKMVAEQRAASALKQNAYGGTKTWAEGQESMGGKKGDATTGLNKVTNEQKAYEKQKKAENPDWNKREDNQWKKRQNTINAAVGSKTVYDTDSKVEVIKDKQVVTDKKIVDEGEEKMAKKGPKQIISVDGKFEKVYGAADEVTKKLNKSELKTTKKIQRQKVKDARKEFGRGSDEVKAAKATKKTEVKKTKQMVKTDKKDRKFVKKDEKYESKITVRKGTGYSNKRKAKANDAKVVRLEKKKAENLQKQKEFGESLG